MFRGRGDFNKKGQITIFIIVAVIIIVAFILFLLLRGNLFPTQIGTRENDPNAFMKTCLEENLREGISLISSQGGYINRTLSTELDGQKIGFLCYTSNYYYPCINQEPVLIQHLERELEVYVSDEVESCFDSLEESFQNQAYEVVKNYDGFEIKLERGKVTLDLEADISATKADETIFENDLRFTIPSKFYDLATVAHEILNQEARFCNFDVEGFRLFYSQYKINKFRTSDLSVVYTVEHKSTSEQFKFAVRGCVIPPGF